MASTLSICEILLHETQKAEHYAMVKTAETIGIL